MTAEEIAERLRNYWVYRQDYIASRQVMEKAATLIESQAAEIARMRAFIDNPPKHKYWRPGEPDCPRDIKAGNGELHTLRCKVCGKDDPIDQICRAALTPKETT